MAASKEDVEVPHIEIKKKNLKTEKKEETEEVQIDGKIESCPKDFSASSRAGRKDAASRAVW